ncbi:MAG: hypothetical protein ACXWC9_07095, partial [Pseudobdellovibrionaceae bacterium]
DWWIIFDTFDLPGAKGSTLWISSKTGIGVEPVTEALEGLTVLGLLKQSANGYEKVKTEINIATDNQSTSDRMRDHALISHQILNHLNDQAKGALRFASFASNIQIIAEMYEKINEAIYEADRKSKRLSRDKMDNIYLTSFTTVTVLSEKGGKGASHV